MVITSRTKVKQFAKLYAIIECSDVDILKECARFPMPPNINGIRLKEFKDVSMLELKWFWSLTDKEQLMSAIIDVMIFSNLPKWKRLYYRTVERLLPTLPVIDFYRAISEWTKQIENAAELFSKMKVDLSNEEKAAGFGDTDPMAIEKMILGFAQKMGISDLDIAGGYSWMVYLFVFQSDYDNVMKQRKYNEIISKKHD